jgi:cytochrome c553
MPAGYSGRRSLGADASKLALYALSAYRLESTAHLNFGGRWRSEPAPLPTLKVKTMKIILGFLLLFLAGPALAQAMAGNAQAGKDKSSICMGCHGIPDYRTAYPHVYHVPLIMGQQQAYIAKALHEYKSDERSHPSMRAIAGSLSDQDIADLAAYFSQAHK